MLSNSKWISYAVKALGAVAQGHASSNAIAHVIGESPSYTAKVVATLRRNKLINDKYELARPLSDIKVVELLTMIDDDVVDKIVTNINNEILAKVTISVEQALA